jgi:hypothetical protein
MASYTIRETVQPTALFRVFRIATPALALVFGKLKLLLRRPPK